MEKSEITELKVTARLVEQNREIAVMERCFGLVEDKAEREEQVPVKTIDETIMEFLNEVKEKAQESGHTIDKEALTEATISTILFLVKHSEPELSLTIHVTKPKQEERKDANSKNST